MCWTAVPLCIHLPPVAKKQISARPVSKTPAHSKYHTCGTSLHLQCCCCIPWWHRIIFHPAHSTACSAQSTIHTAHLTVPWAQRTIHTEHLIVRSAHAIIVYQVPGIQQCCWQYCIPSSHTHKHKYPKLTFSSYRVYRRSGVIHVLNYWPLMYVLQ